MDVPESEGRASVLGYGLYYREFAPAHPRGTILVLHGGPGATHEYLLPHADLSHDGYRVVFMDQLACGRSDRPHNPSLYTLDHNVEEVEGLRKELGLGSVHLVGSSYGGLLALTYAVRYGEHLRSLVTTGGLASVPLTVTEMNRLVHELPTEERSALEKAEARQEYSDPAYLAAVQVFYRRHLCRLWPWPDELTRSLGDINPDVYLHMNGPNEFTITGTIKDIDITPTLSAIRVPTLVTGGRYDEVTPVVARSIHEAIPGSAWVVFEASSHTPFWEERPRYMSVLRDFFRQLDARGG
ncbi:MAG: proline iminopeptidase-family hydrolase [Thermoplasmata archaeon]